MTTFKELFEAGPKIIRQYDYKSEKILKKIVAELKDRGFKFGDSITHDKKSIFIDDNIGNSLLQELEMLIPRLEKKTSKSTSKKDNSSSSSSYTKGGQGYAHDGSYGTNSRGERYRFGGQ